MERFNRLKDMLEGELDRIQSKGEINTSSLEQADKIAHTLKCLATYETMEDQGGGYSEHYPMYPMRGGYYDDGMMSHSAYARGRGRNAKRDSMGRYASDGGSYDGRSYEDGRSYDGDSMDYNRR